MAKRQVTIHDFSGKRTVTVTDYMATASGVRNPSGKPVRFSAETEAEATRNALDYFKCMRSALRIWEE